MTTIITKNSSTASAVPVAGDLTKGELAVNVTDKKLYTKDNGGSVVKLVGSLGNQEASAVAITGGTIDGTPIGGTTASTASFTTVSASGNVTLSGGTANGVLYLNGSKVATSGSALTFDGTNFLVGSSTTNGYKMGVVTSSAASTLRNGFQVSDYVTTDVNITLNNGVGGLFVGNGQSMAFGYNNTTEGMRLTSTGLGIGTSSPGVTLDVNGVALSRLGSGGVTLCGDASPDLGFVGYNYYNVNGTETVPQTIRSSWRHRFGNGATNVWSVGYRAGSAAVSAWTEYLTLDYSGNLGLGLAPNTSWQNTWTALQVGSGISIATLKSNSGNQALEIGSNYYVNAGYKYQASSTATRYEQDGGAHYWYNAPSGTAGNAITFTQAMTLNASGNLGVGTTSPSGKLHVAGGASNVQFYLSNNSYSSYYYQNTGGTSGVSFPASQAYIWDQNGSERARITSAGDFLVYATAKETRGVTIYGTGANGIYSKCTGTVNYWITNDGLGTGSGTIATIYNDTSVAGSITVSGTTTSYVTSSDYRLKENVQPMTGALAKVAQLKPVTYTWKADGSNGQGFIAHELQAIAPDCVVGEKDAVDEEGNIKPQGIDTSFLVATLTAAIQEQQALIQQLTARVAQLESK